MESLKKIPTEPQFDLAFIDADKQNNLNYFLEAERLIRKGGIIVSLVFASPTISTPD